MFSNKNIIKNDLTLELVAILSIYFIQGIMNLARLAISFFLKDYLFLNPSQMSLIIGISTIPWVIKPLFGFFSDNFPLFNYRRRSYLIFSGLLGSLSWNLLATVKSNILLATMIITLISVSTAIADVIVDSLIVEKAQDKSLEKVAELQSLTWGAVAFGSLVTSYLSGWLLEEFSSKTIFRITSFFPFFICIMALLIVEKKINNDVNGVQYSSCLIKQHINQILKVIRQKSILLPTLFICFWQSTPNTESVFFYFITNELEFKAEFLGRIRLVTSVAALLGIFIYQKLLINISFRKILKYSIITSSILGMSMLLLVTHLNRKLGINDYWFTLGDNIVEAAMGKIAFIPVLTLSTKICPKGIEATLFALLMSLINFSGILSNELGAFLTYILGITDINFDKFWILIILANLSTLLPLLIINWLPDEIKS